MKQENNGWVAINGDEYLGETPLWSAREQVLYWVSCEDPPLLCRWKPGQTELERWRRWQGGRLCRLRPL
jgi:sugar lactone lactonase YvrE